MANGFILTSVNEASGRPLDTEAQGASGLVMWGCAGRWYSPAQQGHRLPRPRPHLQGGVFIWLLLVCVL